MSSEGTNFLYPFIDAEESDAGSLLADLASSAEAKGRESGRLRLLTFDRTASLLDVIATGMAEQFGNGGRLFVFGNGGSSTDAGGVVSLFRTPPWGQALHARSLVAEQAVLTALGNDVGFELVFSRQLIAHARAGDIALGISTSGNSTNLVTAFAEARRRDMLTVGLAGYDGGQMASSPHVDHCLVVPADSVHRIQETQAALIFELWSRVQAALASKVGSPNDN
ncbi:MAG TPA: SIS domain-containing protein [Acidimicrobiales bacterium]|nr:SIS domain-containing protein [Acidimicrobiales bacterium]